MGGTRDIPPGSYFHRSIIDRMLAFPRRYRPLNDIGHGPRSQQRRQLKDVEVDDKKASSAGSGAPYFKEVMDPHPQKRPDGTTVVEKDRLYQLDFR